VDRSGPEPVLIGWADEDEVGDLADDVAGVGGPTMVEIGRLRTYVTGSVVLDRDTTDRFGADDPARPDGRGADELEIALLLHELGHLVGLEHVDDPGELMYPAGITRSSYGPGDKEGLAALGAIPCT
jgi:predicted Zn-dependent protease